MRTKKPTFVVGALVLAISVGGGVAYSNHQTSQQIQATLVQVASIVEQAAAADAAQEAAVTEAQALLDSTVGAVAEESTRTALTDAIKAAQDAVSPDPVETVAGLDEAQSALSDVKAGLAAITDADQVLAGAMAAVEASHEQFLLDQATATAADAKTALDASIAAGDTTLAGSEGNVADNAVRETLRAALDSAKAVSGETPDSDVPALEAATTARNGAKADVDNATKAVTDAVAAKAEADRIAAEKAEADRVAAEKAKKVSPSSANGKSSSSTGAAKANHTGGGSSSGRSSAPASPSGNMRQIAEEEAARFGMTVNWKQLSGIAGQYWGGYVMDIDPDSSSMATAEYARTVVRHEAAHMAIWRICGTNDPPITGNRDENVADAWAHLYHGGLAYYAYGYNSSDVEIAKKINAGQCRSDAEIAESNARAERQANMKVGDTVYGMFDIPGSILKGESALIKSINGSAVVATVNSTGKTVNLERKHFDTVRP